MQVSRIVQYSMLRIYTLPLLASPPESSFSVHCGAVSCLERSPFFRDILLSVGGWNFALWKEGAKVHLPK